MKYFIRQRQVYYEDFEVEASSPEHAIDLVDNMEAESIAPAEYGETTNTYLLDSEGFAAKDQPDNATPLDNPPDTREKGILAWTGWAAKSAIVEEAMAKHGFETVRIPLAETPPEEFVGDIHYDPQDNGNQGS